MQALRLFLGNGIREASLGQNINRGGIDAREEAIEQVAILRLNRVRASIVNVCQQELSAVDSQAFFKFASR